jgi:hypothetical protein
MCPRSYTYHRFDTCHMSDHYTFAIIHIIGGSRSTTTLAGVPPSDIRVLPEQQARDKSKAKRKTL